MMKKNCSFCLDEEVIRELEKEKWKTHKSVSFIVNEILKKKYMKGGK